MINRELQTITVNSYSATPNQYGEVNKGTATVTTIQGAVKVNNRTNVTDIRYLDIDIIILTKDAVASTSEIVINNVKYQIQYIIPAYTNRGLNQILCKKI